MQLGGMVDPYAVRFSQSSIRYRFAEGSSVDDLAEELRTGRVKPEDTPPLRLVLREGELYSLDNRRLEAFRRAGVEIPWRIRTEALRSESEDNNMNQKMAANLDAMVEQIKTREDFVVFIESLGQDLKDNPEGWENQDLSAYLDGVGGWVGDMDGYYQNRGEEMPVPLDWKTLGKIFLAARIYE